MESSNRVVRSAPKKRFHDDEQYAEKKRGHWSSRKSIKSKRYEVEDSDYH